MQLTRKTTFADAVFTEINHALQTLLAPPSVQATLDSPAQDANVEHNADAKSVAEAEPVAVAATSTTTAIKADFSPANTTLSPVEAKQSARLMRVNHSGEVAAQALYRGQALFARTAAKRHHLLQAAAEEQQHLTWCQVRLQQLGPLTKPSVDHATHQSIQAASDRLAAGSLLTPIWYMGSFALGSLAGLAGDAWSLGFVEETERQVSDHLDDHLGKLPANDHTSRAILERMRADELTHADNAKQAGAKPLPKPVQASMRIVAKVMTTTSLYL